MASNPTSSDSSEQSDRVTTIAFYTMMAALAGALIYMIVLLLF